MRLIDADEMKDELKDMDFVLTKHNLEDWIDEQPTVDAEPVRHGKWQKSTYICAIVCGACGEDIMLDDSQDYLHWNYCPFCGAKMEAE